MDSLTQIVLGAACGEAVLGKKIGNKALLFGAIGGTIPDLDVIVGSWLYSNEIDAMLFHRGFMHSIVFSILAALLLGRLSFVIVKQYKTNTTTQKDWLYLWFLSLFTHPILDCFTPYGTQLFAPFSNYRVAFNTIAVADPLYTLPFLMAMVLVLCYRRNLKKRRLWLHFGVGISSVYMLFTVCNKFYVDSVFKSSLQSQQIPYSRFTVQPTILNNVLWYGIAETQTGYYSAEYSLLDREAAFKNFIKLPKDRAISAGNFKDITNLSWFSNHYFNVAKHDDSTYIYNDLRYPMLDKKPPYSSVFSLQLYKKQGRLDMLPFEPKTDNLKTVFSALWQRIKGI